MTERQKELIQNRLHGAWVTITRTSDEEECLSAEVKKALDAIAERLSGVIAKVDA